jgi:actin-related protein
MSAPLEKDAEFLDRHSIRSMSRNELEERVLEGNNFQGRGDAAAEIVRRDHEYAEKQEQSRRDFEMAMFNAESDREAKRRQFDRALADEQMAHATALADKQLTAATAVATATQRALWAAAAAGIGALIQAAAAVIVLLK